jgi:hypothetical protein
VKEDAAGGGAIFGEMSGSTSGGKLQIKDSTFEGCRAPSAGANAAGKGGAIFLNASNVNAVFILSAITWTGNNAAYGKDLFLVAPDLTMTVTQTKLACGIANLTLMMGVNANNLTSFFDLYPILYPTDVFYAEPGGSPKYGCGSVNLTCGLLSLILARRDVTGRMNINIYPNFTISQVLLFNADHGYMLKGNLTDMVVYVAAPESSSADALITSISTTEFRVLHFVIPKRLGSTHKSLFECADGSLTISSCSIVADSAPHSMEYSLAVVTDGEFSIADFTLTASITFEDVPMISVDGGAATLTGLTLSSLTTTCRTGLIVMESESELAVSGSTFSNVEPVKRGEREEGKERATGRRGEIDWKRKRRAGLVIRGSETRARLSFIV